MHLSAIGISIYLLVLITTIYQDFGNHCSLWDSTYWYLIYEKTFLSNELYTLSIYLRDAMNNTLSLSRKKSMQYGT